jgi:hypothetical protein
MGPYLALEVVGLSEKRPSLVAGVIIISKVLFFDVYKPNIFISFQAMELYSPIHGVEVV